MKDIEELISKSKKYKNVIIQKKFDSKKNTVAYVTIDDKPRVLKLFVPGFKRQMKTEVNTLKKGSTKINIPVIHKMDEKNNVIIMSYITGKNLCDILNDKKIEIVEKERLIKLLAEWLNDFHKFFKMEENFQIRGDSNLKNFIYNDRIWGVDFEESRIGKPVEDIAGLCASILTTDPMFTNEKFRLSKLFIEYYLKIAPVITDNINDEIAYSLLEKIQYRPEDEPILRKYSKIIKNKGLE
jgi:tRNA A-37 threonylcarbamoyl transferase component Bud32